MPKKITSVEKNQLDKIATFLDLISVRLIEDINSVFEGDYNLQNNKSENDIHFYEFELFEDGYRINFYPMDAKHNQLGFKKILPEYPNGFLRDEGLDVDEDGYDYENDADMDRMDEFYIQLSKNIIYWFNNCWKKAGGSNFKYKASISIHESGKVFDLTHQKWIK